MLLSRAVVLQLSNHFLQGTSVGRRNLKRLIQMDQFEKKSYFHLCTFTVTWFFILKDVEHIPNLGNWTKLHTILTPIQEGSSIFQKNIFGGSSNWIFIVGLVLERVLYCFKNILSFLSLHLILTFVELSAITYEHNCWTTR